MKVPEAYILARLAPLNSSLAAAIAMTAVYGVLSPLAYFYFAIWKFVPYLDAALGAGGKWLGFLLRAIFLVNHDINLFATSSFFIQAGMSACSCGQAGVLGEWFKHSAAVDAIPFHRRHPRVLPAACKLMSIPILILGPGIGIPATILMYGVRTPDSINSAMQIRKYSAWGILACLTVLAVFALLAVLLAARHEPGRRAAALAQAIPTLVSVLLLQFSSAARVRNLYDIQVSLNDDLYYPLIVMTELLQQLLTSWPALMHRCGLADSYRGWRTATWPWVNRRFPPKQKGGDPEAAGPGAVAIAASAAAAEAAQGGAAGAGEPASSADSAKSSAPSPKE